MIIIITDDTEELYLYKKNNISVKLNKPEGMKLTFVFIL